MTWFAFQGLNGGAAVDLAGTQEKQAVLEGFHGYSTAAQAQANPNAVNIITRAFADAWIADYKAAVAEHAQPGGANANILNPATAVSAAATGAVNSIPGLASIGDFFGRLSSGATWLRVLEGVLGVILIAVGIARITHAVPVATSIAKAVK